MLRNDFPISDTSNTDLEARLQHSACSHLRTWYRLLSCSKLIENEVRSRLRRDFNTTLPRYDLMSHLEKHPEGILMGDLSRHLLVTNGNITGITDQLVKEGLVQRIKPTEDRRRSVIKLTEKGKITLNHIHDAHNEWICDLFGQLPDMEITHFLHGLDLLKSHSHNFASATP